MSTSIDNRIGSTETATMRVTDDRIEEFADVSGDTNPLHLDEDHAKETRFNGRIAHGLLVEGAISTALAEISGTVSWLQKELTYKRPVRPGEMVKARAEIVEYLGDDQYLVDVPVVNENGDIVIECESRILIDDPNEDEEMGGDD